MEITGTIKSIGKTETGVSGAGKEWKRQEVVIEFQDGNYTKDLQISFVNKNLDNCLDTLNGLFEGDQAKFYFNLESKQTNGKYFNNINGWKVEAV